MPCSHRLSTKNLNCLISIVGIIFSILNIRNLFFNIHFTTIIFRHSPLNHLILNFRHSLFDTNLSTLIFRRKNWGFQTVVLKLGVATLLRVAKCPKRVAKFEKKKKLVKNTSNKWKIKVNNLELTHLEGRKISWGSRDFPDNFLGPQPKRFENPFFKLYLQAEQSFS